MSLYPGKSYKLLATCKDNNDALADPTTLTFTKQTPAGVQTSVSIGALTHEGTGLYSYTTSESAVGNYAWEAKATGAVTDRDIITVRVIAGLT
jgi:hypothetical protein